MTGIEARRPFSGRQSRFIKGGVTGTDGKAAVAKGCANTVGFGFANVRILVIAKFGESGDNNLKPVKVTDIVRCYVDHILKAAIVVDFAKASALATGIRCE